MRRPDVFNWQPQKIEELTEVIDSRKTTVKEKADALFERTLHFMHMSNWHQLVSDCKILLELSSNDDVPEEFSFLAIYFRQLGLIMLGEYSKAIDDISLMSKMKSEKTISKLTIGFFLSELTRTDASSWEKAFELLLERCVELGVESELGGALVESIRGSRLGEKLDKLPYWNAIWQRLGASVPQLIVPLRLLDAGTNYLMTKRPEVLLSLPLEERKILKEVLKISDESWTSLDR